MSKRRQLLQALGAGALAASFAALAQQPGKVWRVGFPVPRTRPASIDADFIGAFPRGMRELGYVEGKNLVIEWRFADGKPEQLPGLVAELVRLKVDVILATGTTTTTVVQKATRTIPIVMVGNVDPVGAGVIKSLARPGGNTTGPANLSFDVSPKRLELLLAMLPRLSRVAVLLNPSAPTSIRSLASTQAAAQQRRVTILPAEARTPQEIEAAYAGMSREKAAALIVVLNPILVQQRRQIAELAAKYRLPSMTPDASFVEAGCLMSYGDSLTDNYHRAATYVDKIFKGAKPADLPVEEPTKIELVLNRNTAKSLGLNIPQELLLQADRVIG